MEVKELRIGNFVLLEETEIKIHEGYLLKILECVYEESDIKGIPITEESVIKLGFKKNLDHGIEKYIYYNFTYYPDNKQLKIYDRFGSCIHIENIEFLHQLQNIYYSIFQLELKCQL